VSGVRRFIFTAAARASDAADVTLACHSTSLVLLKLSCVCISPKIQTGG
jgi:hypothetical protein